MPNNQFINLEELSKTTQALLSKINEQSNLKVNKSNVEAIVTEGTKIADIEGVELPQTTTFMESSVHFIILAASRAFLP